MSGTTYITIKNITKFISTTNVYHQSPRIENKEEDTTLSTIFERVLLKLKNIYKGV